MMLASMGAVSHNTENVRFAGCPDWHMLHLAKTTVGEEEEKRETSGLERKPPITGPIIVPID